MKLSVYTLIFSERSLEESAQVIAELGYDGIEIRIHTDGVHIPIDYQPEYVRKIKKYIEDLGLEVSALASYVKLGVVEEEWVVNRKMALKVAEVAEILEAPYFRVQAAGYSSERGYEGIRKAFRKQAIDLAKELKKRALQAMPILEQHGGGCIASSAGIIIDLIRGLEPTIIGVLYDPGNAVWEGWEPPRVQVDILKEYIKHVHVKNYEHDPNNPRKYVPAPLDSGILDWREVVLLLKGIGFRGYLSIEDFRRIPPEEKAKEAIKFLKPLVK
ncbi:MAG: hypothetical protein DRN53_03630 [Thermoprotei archaeon]|nr:MAG: hypothetical protein DRN53_03630 [Thermoprotei archaeon]